MRASDSASIARTLVLGVLLACAASPVAAQFIDVVPVGGSPRYLALPPGGSTTIAFELRNPGPLAVEGGVGGELQVPPTVFGEYSFVSQQPTLCTTPVLEPRVGYVVLRFPLAALAPGETRTCTYSVQRAPGSTNDLGFRTCWLPLQGGFNSFCGRVARLGTLPDLELALEPLGPARDGVTLLRLRLLNRAPIDVAERVATTSCHEFEGGPAEPTRFDVDGNFPGGCPAAAATPGCVGGTGTAYRVRAFRLGPVAAGGSTTCLLRVRALRENGLAQVPLFLRGDSVALPAGAIGFDPIREREAVAIGLGLAGAEPVPLGPAVPGVMMLLLLAAGLRAARARAPGVHAA
jgi:hypothetical protein